jgi:transposase
MFSFDPQTGEFRGPQGTLAVRTHDEITRKLAMLLEGECGGLGAKAAAEKYGYSRQRYYQLRRALRDQGASALQSEKRGPKTHYRRTDEAVRQVIRHRFLDPDASAAVIAQKLRQTGVRISQRSVGRVLEEYGLQKKGSTGTTPTGRWRP